MEYSKSYKESSGGWFLFYFRRVKRVYENYFSFWNYRLALQV